MKISAGTYFPEAILWEYSNLNSKRNFSRIKYEEHLYTNIRHIDFLRILRDSFAGNF